MAKIKKSENEPEFSIQGYGIELDHEDIHRIDHIVDAYEQNIVKDLDTKYMHETKRSDRVADSIAAFGGSWKFIGIFAGVLLVWVLWNTLPFVAPHFDPQPFILLNLCLSFVAAFQAPIIMMSQNRQTARDKHESVIDFAINFKAEQEIDDIQHHLHRLENDIAAIRELLTELNNKAPK